MTPDLIILDLIFGERELLGWQLLQKLRMDPRLDEIPVIVCSAAVKTLQELEGHLTEQGVLAVVKPFTVDQLEEPCAARFRIRAARRSALGAWCATMRRAHVPIGVGAPRTGPGAVPSAPRAASP